MRTIRNISTLIGLSLVLFALGVVAARGQVISSTHFAGTFTLPFDAQWGAMTLPAGDYSLYYGNAGAGGVYLVEVAGKASAGPHGLILSQAHNEIARTENALICVRDGNGAIVSELRMGDTGESVTFPLLHGVKVESKVIAKHQNTSGNTQVAQVTIPIERAPVK